MRGEWGGEPPPTSKILPFRRTKMVVKCTFAGNLLDKRPTVNKKSSQTKSLADQPLKPPQNLEATSLPLLFSSE